jgi:hypothetical protein
MITVPSMPDSSKMYMHIFPACCVFSPSRRRFYHASSIALTLVYLKLLNGWLFGSDFPLGTSSHLGSSSSHSILFSHPGSLFVLSDERPSFTSVLKALSLLLFRVSLLSFWISDGRRKYVSLKVFRNRWLFVLLSKLHFSSSHSHPK